MNKHVCETIQLADDRHVISENADFSKLDALYAGRKAYYGDFHCHSASGGNSDGRTTPAEWKEYMKQLHIDFVGLMDHRQVRHMYLDEFDPELFVYGTEPGMTWRDPALSHHYVMVVPQPECLLRVLEKFPDVYEFTGGKEGTFVYKTIEKSRYLEIVQAVLEEGGTVIHPHPKQVMQSDNPEDYFFGDGTALETMYAYQQDMYCENTVDNYKLWMELLARGHKIYNTGTTDCHGEPTNEAFNTVYSHEKNGAAYLSYLRKGDLTAGYAGIKMSIDDTAMGGTAAYAPGQTLCIRVDDGHPDRWDENESYRLEVLTDKGLACSMPLTLPFAAALQVQERNFYRAVVIRESDGAPVAIGNPIWLKK